MMVYVWPPRPATKESDSFYVFSCAETREALESRDGMGGYFGLFLNERSRIFGWDTLNAIMAEVSPHAVQATMGD